MKLGLNRDIASLNTGAKVIASVKDIDDIFQLPELANLFPRQQDIFDRIKKSILKMGYDDAECIVTFKHEGKLICVDGNTRLAVVKELVDEGHDELLEIPCVVKNFETLEEAIEYAKHRQFDRRQFSAAEVLAIAKQDIDLKYGEGQKLDAISEETGISKNTLNNATAINNYGSQELQQDVIDGKTSLTEGAKKARAMKKAADAGIPYTEEPPKKKKNISDDDITDALEDHSGEPHGFSVSHVEHPSEAMSYQTHSTPEIDKWTIEKNIQIESAKRQAYGEAFEKCMKYILFQVENGMSAKEIYNSDFFADLSPDVLMKKELPPEAEAIFDNF